MQMGDFFLLVEATPVTALLLTLPAGHWYTNGAHKWTTPVRINLLKLVGILQISFKWILKKEKGLDFY